MDDREGICAFNRNKEYRKISINSQRKIISSELDAWLAGVLAGHPGRDVQQADKCCLAPKKMNAVTGGEATLAP